MFLVGISPIWEISSVFFALPSVDLETIGEKKVLWIIRAFAIIQNMVETF